MRNTIPMIEFRRVVAAVDLYTARLHLAADVRKRCRDSAAHWLREGADCSKAIREGKAMADRSAGLLA